MDERSSWMQACKWQMVSEVMRGGGGLNLNLIHSQAVSQSASQHTECTLCN